MTPEERLLILIAGIGFLLSALCAFFRHAILAPRADNWPKAPKWLRLIIFVFGAGLMMTGWYLVGVARSGRGLPMDGAMPVLLISVIVFLYKAGMLINLASQFHDPRFWQAMNRLSRRLCAKHA